MRTAAILSSASAPFYQAYRTHHGSEPNRERETAHPHENAATDTMGKASKRQHYVPLPVRRAGWRNGETENGAGRQSTRQAGPEPRHRPISPQARSRKEDEGGDDETGKQREDEPEVIEKPSL